MGGVCSCKHAARQPLVVRAVVSEAAHAAIPLLMALYPSLGDAARATELVTAYKRYGRYGRTKGGHMPEDRSQRRQIDKGEMQYKRGGHKAKHNG